jgi:hypothetical protein
MPDSPVEVSPLAPIFEGEDVVAHFTDGTSALLFIPQYKIRHIAGFLEVVDNECKLLELVCTLSQRVPVLPGVVLPADWVDRLTDASHAELVEKARILNLDRALAWADRQTRVHLRLQPLAAKAKKS